jgi:hypothetical protein
MIRSGYFVCPYLLKLTDSLTVTWGGQVSQEIPSMGGHIVSDVAGTTVGGEKWAI